MLYRNPHVLYRNRCGDERQRILWSRASRARLNRKGSQSPTLHYPHPGVQMRVLKLLAF